MNPIPPPPRSYMALLARGSPYTTMAYHGTTPRLMSSVIIKAKHRTRTPHKHTYTNPRALRRISAHTHSHADTHAHTHTGFQSGQWRNRGGGDDHLVGNLSLSVHTTHTHTPTHAHLYPVGTNVPRAYQPCSHAHMFTHTPIQTQGPRAGQ